MKKIKCISRIYTNTKKRIALVHSDACQEPADDVVLAKRIEANRKISRRCFFASLIATLMPEKKGRSRGGKAFFRLVEGKFEGEAERGGSWRGRKM